MIGGRYRVKSPILAILSIGGGTNRIAISLPVNAILKVVAGPLNGNRLMDVEWEGKVVMVFVQDLQSRAETLDEAPQVK